MAAAQFAQMGSMPNMIKNDLDMDTFFDFSQTTPSHDQRSPSRASAIAGPSTQNANNISYDDADDRQVFAGPSHEYDRFRQQTGIPVGDVGNLSHLNQPIDSFGGFNSGIDEMSFGSGMDGSWATGIDMDADMNMGFGSNVPAMFYQPNKARGDFVDPTNMETIDEPQSNVGRLWPGMHQQQAQQLAMAKARAQQQQQQQQAQFMRQQQMQQKQHQLQQQQQQLAQQSKSAGKQRASSQQTDPHVEESISRLLNNMRQNTHVATIPEDDDDASNSFMANMSRMKKDEEDMDDDERLLASDEGKKLSSKERRQLRNKVSARAFRSRRKGVSLST